ncbi:MAG: acyl-ACP--UDP-N-acetylglucosamine O-acyltransferase [Candidatus Eisenbacteria bacterium]|nr:acyl-ACP--UDP-N-acetylglucosamine O-acyltransferase [Candidatus Eisenbacteria bacterium]
MTPEPDAPRGGIHPSAIIEPGARLGRDVSVGPCAWIGPKATIGDRTRIGAHVVVEGWTDVGADCIIHHGAVVGAEPQDLKYRNEPSRVIIGDGNTIREFVTIHRGTLAGEETRIGDGNLLMAYVHIAHNCRLGNHTILANAVNLAGHVIIEDYARVGGVTPVHQFVRIGAYAFIGGGSRAAQDVPPFFLAAGNPIRMIGVNVIGLRRAGFSAEARLILQRAYKILYRSKRNTTQALAAIRETLPATPEIERLVAFIDSSERGIS